MSVLTKRPNGFWNIVEPTSSGKRRYMSTKTKSKQEANSILGALLEITIILYSLVLEIDSE